jgi:hypothetical protein
MIIKSTHQGKEDYHTIPTFEKDEKMELLTLEIVQSIGQKLTK